MIKTERPIPQGEGGRRGKCAQGGLVSGGFQGAYMEKKSHYGRRQLLGGGGGGRRELSLKFPEETQE